MDGQEKTTELTRLAVRAIVLLCALVFLPAINHSTLWEDAELIGGIGIGNPKSASDCFARPFLYNYYRPLTSLSFYAENHLFNGSAIVHHETNIALHLIPIPVIFALLII